MVEHPLSAGAAHRRAGEHPAQLLRRTRLAAHRGPQPAAAAGRARPRGLDVATPPALRRRRRSGDRQWSRARRAARRRAAGVARQGRGVAGPRGLHQHGARLQPGAERVVGGPRDPGADRAVLTRHRLDADPASELLARHGQLVDPAGSDQLLHLGGAGHPGEQDGRRLLRGAGEQHVAGVGVGGARLGVEVIAVVPHHDQAEVVDGREGRGAGADDHAAGTSRDREELAVAHGRSHVGGEAHVVARPELGLQRGTDPRHVAGVGHADQRALPAGVRRRDDLGQHGGPVVRRRGRPRRAGRLPRGQAAQEGVGVLDPRPPGRPGRRDRRRSRLGGGLLRGGVPRRHGEAEDVGAGTGVAVGEDPAQLGDLGGEDGLGADHAAQRLEGAGVVGPAGALHDEAVDVLAGEAHLHPRSGDGRVGHRARDGVVEGAVEVGQRDVDEDPRHRVGLGRLPRRGLAAAGGGRLGARVVDGSTKPREHVCFRGLVIAHAGIVSATYDGPTPAASPARGCQALAEVVGPCTA